jgi:hypothetical protein
MILELFRGENLKRLATAFLVFMAQQATGATAYAIYSPQFFSLLAGSHAEPLLLSAIFGAVKIFACGAFVIWFSESLSRRQVLIGGALAMAVCQLSTAVVVRAEPQAKDGGITTSAIVTVVLIYLFVVAYNFSWGPLPVSYYRVVPSLAPQCSYLSNGTHAVLTRT